MGPVDTETFWVKSFREYSQSVFLAECAGTLGTAWIVSARDDAFLVATAAHVVMGAITSNDVIKLRHEACDTPIIFNPSKERIIHSPDVDLAVIEVHEPPPARPVPLAHRVSPEPGKHLLGIAPLGIEVGWAGFSETVTRVFGLPTITFCRGVISAVGQTEAATYRYCLDGNVNRGMSGGPAWDINGAVMGMIVAYSGVPAPPDGANIAWPGFGIIVPVGYLARGLTDFEVEYEKE